MRTIAQLIAGAVSSAVAITESDDGSALTRKRYLPEYKACGRVRCAPTARSVPCKLRVGPGAAIGRHTHAGEVHAYNVSGSRQLDTGEIAGPGSYVYEPAGHVDSWSCVDDEPCIVQIIMWGRLTCRRANDDLLDYSDTPNLREFYLGWCGENGFEPVAIGAAA